MAMSLGGHHGPAGTAGARKLEENRTKSYFGPFPSGAHLALAHFFR